jgi:hypothetical protein
MSIFVLVAPYTTLLAMYHNTINHISTPYMNTCVVITRIMLGAETGG